MSLVAVATVAGIGAAAGGVYSLTEGGNALKDIGIGAVGGAALGAGGEALGLFGGAGGLALDSSASVTGSDLIGGASLEEGAGLAPSAFTANLGSSSSSFLSSLLGSGGGSGGFSLGGLGGSGGSSSLPNLLSLGSGLTGLYEASAIQGLAKEALSTDNPYAPYRQSSALQLQALLANPSLITQVPGYNFQQQQGEKAITRTMGAGGFINSGNEAVALEQYGQNYATNFLLPYEQQLATLAGANFVPNSATGISGYVSGANIASQGLASLGYAAGGGANNSSTLALISALAAKG